MECQVQPGLSRLSHDTSRAPITSFSQYVIRSPLHSDLVSTIYSAISGATKILWTRSFSCEWFLRGRKDFRFWSISFLYHPTKTRRLRLISTTPCSVCGERNTPNRCPWPFTGGRYPNCAILNVNFHSITYKHYSSIT